MKVIKLNHERVNFIWTTDWHIAAKPPGRRQDDYQAAILAKLEFVCELTHKLKGVSLCGGDVFHVKNPKSPSNPISLIFTLLHALRRYPTGKVYGAIGNHDLMADRMDSLSHQPLGLLIAAGVYKDLNEEPILFVNEDVTVRVLVETLPYVHSGSEALNLLLATDPRPQGITHRILIVHAYGEPGNGGGMFGEAIGYNQIQHLDYDFMLWGHDHSRKETQEVGAITHIHTGALARAAYDYDEIDRPIVATIISFATDGVRYKEKEIPVKPLNIAFKSADKPVEDVAKSDELIEFFDAMDAQVDDIQSTDPIEVVKALCPADEPQLFELVTKDLCELA